MIKNINYLFVTVFGIGTFRFAPGTFNLSSNNSFFYSLFHIINLQNIMIINFFLLVFIYSFYAVNEYIRDNKNKDPKEVVIDELIGQSIPIYLYEIAHQTEKSFQEAILIYFIFLFYSDFLILKNLFQSI